MTQNASVTADNLKIGAIDSECETHWPPKMLSTTRANPITEHSSTLPGLQKRRYSPMNTAIGIVAAIVNAPQGLSLSALTTTSATTASRMIMIIRTVSSAVNPPT